MQELFDTVVTTFNPLLDIFVMVSGLAGGSLVLLGMIGIARANETNARSGQGVSRYLRYVLIGSLLLIAFTLLDTTSMTLLGQESRKVLDYSLAPNSGLDEQSRYFLGVFYAVLVLLGAFSFIRGWLILSGVGSDARVSRGLVFIVGGTLAINMDAVLRISANTVAQFNPQLAENIQLFIPS